ncbi:flavodoxin [uncultured Helicobacter sp.]|uniref:flavodoxin n=1 Tax=uncultured Helicobacter sp. TaxID=175537 RepID=UPI001C3A7C34|nr:flavodoxin [Candidatus Helicobacter avicola]
MQKIGIFYGSDSSNTQHICQKVAKELGNAETFDVAKASKEEFMSFDNLILATPTYGSGDLQDDWESFLGALSEEDFAGKVIAFIGVGDQDTYSDTFCNGVSYLYHKAAKAKRIGQTANEGYYFDDTEALVDGKLVGLLLDEDNQSDLSDERISKWVTQIRGEFV